ncbi:MAG: hypothetical protein WCK60_00925 [Candidatus Nomurabacteria bacterium]
MLQIIFKETFRTFELMQQGFLFVWIGFTSFLDWLNSISHPVLKANTFWAQLGFFIASLLFLPFPWWVSFIFIFLPPLFSLPLIILFYLMFIASFAFEIVFL